WHVKHGSLRGNLHVSCLQKELNSPLRIYFGKDYWYQVRLGFLFASPYPVRFGCPHKPYHALSALQPNRTTAENNQTHTFPYPIQIPTIPHPSLWLPHTLAPLLRDWYHQSEGLPVHCI